LPTVNFIAKTKIEKKRPRCLKGSNELEKQQYLCIRLSLTNSPVSLEESLLLLSKMLTALYDVIF